MERKGKPFAPLEWNENDREEPWRISWTTVICWADQVERLNYMGTNNKKDRLTNCDTL